MVEAVEKNEMSLAQKARLEVKKEFEKEAIAILKNKYKELHRAETVVGNLKREIEDLEESVEQGNLG